jgi:hypothetical protein
MMRFLQQLRELDGILRGPRCVSELGAKMEKVKMIILPRQAWDKDSTREN